MKFVLVNGRAPIRSPSAHCAVSRSERVTCEASAPVALTAITRAISATVGSQRQHTSNARASHDHRPGHERTCPSRAARSATLRPLQRAIRDSDAPLVGQEVLQAQVQRRPHPQHHARHSENPWVARFARGHLAQQVGYSDNPTRPLMDREQHPPTVGPTRGCRLNHGLLSGVAGPLEIPATINLRNRV